MTTIDMLPNEEEVKEIEEIQIQEAEEVKEIQIQETEATISQEEENE